MSRRHEKLRNALSLSLFWLVTNFKYFLKPRVGP